LDAKKKRSKKRNNIKGERSGIKKYFCNTIKLEKKKQEIKRILALSDLNKLKTIAGNKCIY
jgi:hypothetical protein